MYNKINNSVSGILNFKKQIVNDSQNKVEVDSNSFYLENEFEIINNKINTPLSKNQRKKLNKELDNQINTEFENLGSELEEPFVFIQPVTIKQQNKQLRLRDFTNINKL